MLVADQHRQATRSGGVPVEWRRGPGRGAPRRRQLGLRARAAVASGLLALVLSAGLSVAAYQLTRSQLISDREDGAQRQAYVDARLVRNALRSPDPDVTTVLASLGGNAGTMTLAQVGAEWFSGSVGVGPDAVPDALGEAAAEGSAGRQRVRVAGAPYVAVGVPLPAVDALYFEVSPLADVERALEVLARGLMVAATVATAAGAGVGWYTSGRVLRPLRRMSLAAGGIARGTLDTRLDAVGDPDLEPLVASFNRMAEAVQERIARESRFASDVSHELRSPLAAMLAAIEVARRRHQPGALVEDEALDVLQRRVEAFNRLVLDLLEISRLDAGVATLRPEPVDPARLVGAVLDSMGRADVPVDMRADLASPLLLDKRRLGQMVMNLVENADRYGKGATRVEIDLDDRVVTIAVEDAGPGVAEHERSYVFERFARGEAAIVSAAGGTGLGLSLVAQHAKLHGGVVRLEDRVGGGARFVILLPRRDADGEPTGELAL
ncbi:MAG: HAMP domain-containing protein [Acidimicrobiia bacterium]|nr:HAMP domain-containing protein [Acidimicrobiia bacterium]